MSSEWRFLQLRDCLHCVVDNRGKTPPISDAKTPYGLIEINAIVGSVKHPDMSAIRKYVSQETYQSWFRSGHPLPGDVLFSTVGSIAEIAIIKNSAGCIAQNLVGLRANKEIVEPDYLYYVLVNPVTQSKLRTLDISSVQPSIKVPHLLATEIAVPKLSLQRDVIRVLTALDDRITLLRETNATLEAIAQAMFKSWFVHFDPVRAKAEGRQPEGMDATAAALFPDSFEESELGLVPKGWKVKPVGDAVDCLGGGTPDTKEPSYWEPAEHCWTTPKDLSGLQSPVLLRTERQLSSLGLAKVSSGLLPAGTLLLSSRAPIGYLAIAQMPVAVNQGYIAIPPGGELSPVYMLFWCRQNMEGIKGRANGSTFMEISKKAFRPIPALVPTADVLDAFANIAEPLFERLIENERQAQTLTQLRDTLLPRLISGQLRLPEAEQAVEEALA
ncbi:restriction endonuclease subunit S [Ectopseudomonas oleovorans]|uniref:restriction endonuclease subunit S n=1 Tax=Ectopseudomonas oleovorans TaxID=301 RepID=UPI003F1CF9F3